MRVFLSGCFKVLLAGGVIFVLGLLLADRIFPPLVHRSSSTGECVKVEPADAGSCLELPQRYEVVWVR